MKDKHPTPTEVSAGELQLIEQLRAHPELMERVKSLMEIVKAEGAIKRADEIEALLIEQMRRLGKTTMESWACGAEKTLGAQLKQQDASAVVRKKKR
jgi:hypothetical protein